MNLVVKAKELENHWREYNLPDSHLEKFVFENLYILETDEYSLSTLFSLEAINTVIKLGEQVINADRHGKKLVTIEHERIEHPTSQQYINLFSQWEKAGWVKIEETNNNDILVKVI